MRYRTFALTAAVMAVAVSGCNKRPEPKAEAPVAEETPAPAPPPAGTAISVAEGFHHQADFEASGYYLSPTAFRTGNYEFTHIGVGMPSDFQTWEKGDRTSTFGPILIAFDDVSSPRIPTELGGENHAVSVRVLPQAYSFDAGRMTFRGTDPKLGEVLFVGTFDKAALQRAKASGASQEIVLRGDLKIGEAPVRKVSFTYWVGD